MVFKGAATSTIHVSPCDDGPHGPVYFNTCYPVGTNVCEGLGGMDLLEEVCLWGELWGTQCVYICKYLGDCMEAEMGQSHEVHKS